MSNEYQPLLDNLVSYCFKPATFSYVDRGSIRYSCNLHLHYVLNRKIEVKPFISSSEEEFCMQYIKL